MSSEVFPAYEDGLAKHLYLKHMVRLNREQVARPVFVAKALAEEELQNNGTTEHFSLEADVGKFGQQRKPSKAEPLAQNPKVPVAKQSMGNKLALEPSLNANSKIERLTEQSIFNNFFKKSAQDKGQPVESLKSPGQNSPKQDKPLFFNKEGANLPPQLFRSKEKASKSPAKPQPKTEAKKALIPAHKSPAKIDDGKKIRFSNIKGPGAVVLDDSQGDRFKSFEFEGESLSGKELKGKVANAKVKEEIPGKNMVIVKVPIVQQTPQKNLTPTKAKKKPFI